MSRISSFIVSGKGRFPVDMLRYDCCWPRDGASAEAILTPVDREVRAAPREVRLVTGKQHGAPCVGRWASFGWTVTLCFDEYGNALNS